METYHTLYEWCLVNNIRLHREDSLDADVYMLQEINVEEFKSIMDNRGYDADTPPNKPEKFLELRMYGLVPYNLSPIQQGIQFNHANDIYRLENGDDKRYIRFLQEWKTNILLNGGTSNEGHLVSQGFKEELYVGTMQQHVEDLVANGIKIARFYEPDLNSMLTAIVFLVDERVFNKKLYPDFTPEHLPLDATDNEVLDIFNANNKAREEWVKFIGGPKNEFLRDFLSNKRLA